MEFFKPDTVAIAPHNMSGVALRSSQLAALQSGSAGASSQVLSAVNTLTVTLLPNVAVLPPAVVSVGGLDSSTEDSASLALHGPGAGLFVGGVGQWSRTQRVLRLEVAPGRMLAGGGNIDQLVIKRTGSGYIDGDIHACEPCQPCGGAAGDGDGGDSTAAAAGSGDGGGYDGAGQDEAAANVPPSTLGTTASGVDCNATRGSNQGAAASKCANPGHCACEGPNTNNFTAQNVRDFDYLGYRYGLMSSIGTAGLNNVLAMLPARDEAEFKLFPAEDVAWINKW